MAVSIAPAVAQCPPPGNGFNDIYDFTQLAAGNSPSGVVIDRAENLYGLLPGSGDYGAGLLYKLTERGGNWLLNPIHSFLGGSSGSPNNFILGPQGVYGGADGGIQNPSCNGINNYCGQVYKIRPGPNACTTALCSWNESTIYQFTGGTDADNGSISAFDPAGNLYGISAHGGAYGHGTVFELAPSQGGWTETILHSFGEVGWPTSLLVGHDGNLYGTINAGGYYGYGVVFQLVPSGGGWTNNIIYTFTGGGDGFGPGALVQDSLGNLYGTSVCAEYPNGPCGGIDYNYYGLIFKLSPSGGGWQFSVLYNTTRDNLCEGYVHALTLDAAGYLYAAEGALYDGCPSGWGALVDVTHLARLASADEDFFQNLTADASGNLYGTSYDCGRYGDGMVWRYGP